MNIIWPTGIASDTPGGGAGGAKTWSVNVTSPDSIREKPSPPLKMRV
jgi:hypothetical protein